MTATTSLDPEEKIRQRRERVEQWVREREAAKKAEEVANQPINELVGSTLTTTYATQGWTTVEEVATRKDDDNEDDHQGQAKGWNLEDDDDDDAMEIDHEVVPGIHNVYSVMESHYAGLTVFIQFISYIAIVICRNIKRPKPIANEGFRKR